MSNSKLKTKVVHSKSKPAYNVVSITLGQKYKIARVSYVPIDHEGLMDRNREEAKRHAQFISDCFNNSEKIYDAKIIDENE